MDVPEALSALPCPGHSQGTGDLWKQELFEPIPGVSTSCANLVLTLPLAWSSDWDCWCWGASWESGGELVWGWVGLQQSSGSAASPFLQSCWKSQAGQGWGFTAEGFFIFLFPFYQ